MKQYCLALDLKEDEALIKEYEAWHTKEKIWPEITKSIRESGIIDLKIYRTGNRMFMIMQTEDDFSFSRKKAMDDANEKVQEWEALMWKFQQPLPGSKEGEKWVLMNEIFSLNA